MLVFTTTPPAHVFWAHATHKVLGPLLLGFTRDHLLCRLSFGPKQSAMCHILKEWGAEWLDTRFEQGSQATEKSAASALRSLQKEELPPILLVGTTFQHRVWTALLDIEQGQTLTYGELASRIGKPKAPRAVGTALGANPAPLFVPCHRVVSTTGLGGFTGGLAIKKKLLATEK